jgi:hypothetical protein
MHLLVVNYNRIKVGAKRISEIQLLVASFLARLHFRAPMQDEITGCPSITARYGAVVISANETIGGRMTESWMRRYSPSGVKQFLARLLGA